MSDELPDLYEALGVSRESSYEEIRGAYRKHAHRTHPDRQGGDVVAFQKVQQAYDVLGDQRRRSRYDATGATDNPDRTKALEAVASLFLQAIEELDVDRADLCGAVVEQIQAQRRNVQREISRIEGSIRKRQRALKRVRRRGAGTNLLAAVIEGDIKNMNAALARGREAIAEREEWLAIAKDYAYDFDKPAPAQPMDATTIAFNWTR